MALIKIEVEVTGRGDAIDALHKIVRDINFGHVSGNGWEYSENKESDQEEVETKKEDESPAADTQTPPVAPQDATGTPKTEETNATGTPIQPNSGTTEPRGPQWPWQKRPSGE